MENADVKEEKMADVAKENQPSRCVSCKYYQENRCSLLDEEDEREDEGKSSWDWDEDEEDSWEREWEMKFKGRCPLYKTSDEWDALS